MYTIYADGTLMTTSQDEKTLVESPIVTLEANKAGTFTFTIYPDHSFYNRIRKHDTVLRVERDGEIVFQGVAVTEDVNMLGGKSYSCEGELTYLNDSILRPKKYTNQTVQSLLSAYLTEHNSQVEAKKRFTLGDVDVTGGSNILRYTNYQTTMKEIQDDLIENFGGFISVRYSGATKFIDYHLGSQRTNSQTIELGKNLLSYSSNLDTTDICTVLVPLGAREEETSVEGLETRITIKSVNDNKDYLESATGIATYGRITKVETWDDVTVPSVLKTKGQQWLSDQQFDNVVISCSAVDLSYTDSQVQRFRLLDTVRIISDRHGMDKYFLLSKMTINLNEPGKDRFTFGKTEQVGLTAKSNNTTTKLQAEIAGIPPASSIIADAVDLATQLITGADGGYVLLDRDGNDQPYRILIMDNNDKSRAVNIIQINKNGIGFSTSGINGPYRNAWTIDGRLNANFIKTGQINADLITTGTLNADLIKTGKISSQNGETEINMSSGVAKLADCDVKRHFAIKDSNNKEKFWVSATVGVGVRMELLAEVLGALKTHIHMWSGDGGVIQVNDKNGNPKITLSGNNNSVGLDNTAINGMKSLNYGDSGRAGIAVQEGKTYVHDMYVRDNPNSGGFYTLIDYVKAKVLTDAGNIKASVVETPTIKTKTIQPQQYEELDIQKVASLNNGQGHVYGLAIQNGCVYLNNVYIGNGVGGYWTLDDYIRNAINSYFN